MTAEEYFQEIADEVFAKLLYELGAIKASSQPLLVRFDAAGWFVVLLALAEDGPRYSPRVEIGPRPELGVVSTDKQIDIMHTVPADSPFRRYNLDWRYSNPAEMRNVFTRIQREIFEPYTVPVLRNHALLAHLVTSRSKEVKQEWTHETAAHNDAVFRAKAQAAIATKNYRAFLELMANIPPDRQTHTERARLQYAAKKLREQNSAG